MTPATALKTERRRAGMTREELASRLDVSMSSLNKWESGHQPLPIARALQTERILRAPWAIRRYYDAQHIAESILLAEPSARKMLIAQFGPADIRSDPRNRVA